MNRKMTDKFHFLRPEEAPVFTPTEDEFKDPLAYINKIRPQAEAAGICKIKPPANWQPPFAVDVDSFKFTPRIQRLNELEAKTRIKLNFLDQIAKFWELQGSSLKIPTIEKKAVDLYTLHKLVTAEGGKDKVNNDKKWNRLAARMGHNPQKCYGALLKSHYEKILFPYDMFKKKEPHLIPGEKSETLKKGSSPQKSPTKSMRMGGKATKQVYEHIEDKNGNSTRVEKVEIKSKELKRLAFYGAGPKMAGYNKQSLSLTVSQAQDTKAHSRKPQTVQDPLAKYVCHICKGGDAEEKMLLCDGCDDSYHTFCLQPPLPEVPKGDWRCPRCVAEEVSKPGEAFGFEQAQREYTLQQFGEMADQFKSDYFNMPVHMVTSELVEKEFWRIVSAIDEDVTVEYGADLHTMDHGSGFPTGSSSNIEPQDAVYTKSGWNLNNLPVLLGSVLGHINADISGMKVPWMYVGMCFATFCWHNEDHWSYSINYLHWGEPKTWYGVPGCRANDFEIAMKQAAPELFHSQPDLLHQLVTIMNPNILMQAGVPVYRMDQKAGEFIVTFPRAYHAGFNQGYNFAEAVNFAPADWLAMGRDCITHYSNLHRYCVFSHDELVCKMAHDYEKLDQWIAVCTYKDMAKMLETERELRKVVLSWGLTGSERVAFEMLPDDNRLCEFCKTTCFLSAITCPCTENQLVCLRHYDKLCECPSETHVLKYRYTLDEIPLLIKNLQEYTAEYENWSRICKDKVVCPIADCRDEENKIEMDELRELVEEAKKNNYPNSQLVETVKQVSSEAEKLSKIAKSLLTSSVRTRKSSTAPTKPAYTVSELQVLLNDLEKLPVKMKETKLISKLISKLNEMNNAAKYYMVQQDSSEYDSKQIKAFLDEAMQLDVEIPDLQEIQTIYKRMKWLESVESFQGMWNINQLKLSMDIGESLPCHHATLNKLRHLSSLKEFIVMWEEKAQRILNAKKEKFTLEDVECVLGEAVEQPVALLSLPALRELVLKTNVWLQKVKLYENKSEYPYIDDLENLVTKGEAFPLYLKPLNILRSQVHGTKLWKEMCARAFLKKNSCITLIEALVPRREIHKIPCRGKRKRFDVENPNHQLASMLLDLRIPDLKTAGEIAKAYEKRQAWETEEIISLRKYNLEKKRHDIGDSLYCVCQKPFDEFMIRCELCYEWFHVTCVPLPLLDNTIVLPDDISSQAYVCYKIAIGEIKYFGPCCARSKRPKLDTILDLLVKLQKLPVKIVEGEAIHCLTQRAMCWMDKAKEFLNGDDISEALKTIKTSNALSTSAPVIFGDATAKRRNSETVKFREYGEISNKIKKDAHKNGNISQQENFITDNQVRQMEGISDIKGENSRRTLSLDTPCSVEHNGLKKKGLVPEDWNRNSQKMERDPEDPKLKNLGSGRKSFPIPKNFQEPVIRLPAGRIFIAENLLVEAGLMEVCVECDSRDISDDIWRIVEASKSKPVKEEGFCIQKVQEIINKEIGEKEIVESSLVESLPGSSQATDSKRIARKPMKRKLTSISLDEEENTTVAKSSAQEYDDDCAANPCKQPSGKGIDWVQCDAGCDLWFHLICVGLKKSQVKKLDTFVCQACAPKNQVNQKSGDSDGSSCDTDSKMSESGKTSICSNKENDNVNIDNCSLPATKMDEGVLYEAGRRFETPASCCPQQDDGLKYPFPAAVK